MKHEIEKSKNTPDLKGGLSKKYESVTKIMSVTQKELGEVELPRMFNQLVIFIIDGSRSMQSLSINKISKGKDIENNIHQIIKRLKSSKNKASFDIVNLAFSNSHINSFGMKQVTEIPENENFNPVKLIEQPKDTFLFPALKEANEIIKTYFQKHEGKRNAATILMMTDGQIDDYLESSTLIEEMKIDSRVVFSISFLDSEIDEASKYYNYNENSGNLDYEEEWSIEEVRDYMKKVAEKLSLFASSEEHFSRSVDPEKVRSQMIKSISLVSKMLIQ